MTKGTDDDDRAFVRRLSASPSPTSMVTPSRGLSIVEAEVGVLTTAMKRGQLWSRSSESLLHPALLAPFIDLKRSLAGAKDLVSKE